MIMYNGIKVQNKCYYLAFINELKKEILIPMEEKEAKRIGLYIDKLSTVNKKTPDVETDSEELRD